MDNEYTKKEKELNEKITLATNYIKSKKYEQAKRILGDYLKYALDYVKETESVRFFSFRDEIEFYAATKIISINKKFSWTKFKLSYVYNLLMYIANEEKEFDMALSYGANALYYNPMDANNYFELAETYKFRQDYESMFKITKESYKILFDASELSRYYRNLGYYYTEKQEYDLAFALYIISISYEASETSFHEIGYIRSELNDMDYTLTLDEIKKLLKDNDIEIGIPEVNKDILTSYIKENDKKDNLVLLSSARSMLRKTNVDLLTTTEALSIINIPRISTKDMFDENKNRVRDIDIKRFDKNIKYLKEHKIDCKEDMKGLPLDYITSLKTKEEIMMGMIRDYALATISMYAINNKSALIPIALESMNIKLDLRKCMNIKDIDLVSDISKGLIDKNSLDDNTWLFERVYAYLWVLGLVKDIDYKDECDVIKIDEVLININSFDELDSKCNLLDKEVILEKLDLLTRLNYSLTSNALRGVKLDINPSVLREQKESLEWVLNFKIENLMNDYITIDYKKNDFNFSFKMPNELHIKELVNIKKPRNMISLSDSREDILITFINHSNLNKKELDDYYNNDVIEYTNFGWTKKSEFIYKNDLGNIYEVFLNVVLDDKKKPEFGIVKYYFILNNHIVSIESLLERDLDYNNEDNLLNSENRYIAFNIVNSLKEKVDTLLDIKVLDSFISRDNPNEDIIIDASYNAFNEILTKIDEIKDDDKLDKLVDKEIKQRLKDIKEYSIDNNDDSIFFYKDYESNFNFKIYVEDIFLNGKKNIIRILSAYFVSKKEETLYKVSLSVGPFKYPTGILKIGSLDEEDDLSNNMITMFYEILDSIKYKKSSKKK